jgi:Family of unknown function (DUF6011)
MTVIQDGLFGSPSYFCERCGRQLSNRISMALHKGPVCRAKSGAKNMDKENLVDMRQWGTRFNYKGFGGCSCHCYIKVKGNVVLCTEAPDNEGTSITNMAEGIAQLVCQSTGIMLGQLIWIEHYTHEEMSTIGETFDRVEFDLVDARFYNPRWSYLDAAAALKMLEA